MKILVVCQYYYPEPFRITDICETLVQKGYEVTVLTGLPNYPEGRILNDYSSGKKREELVNGVKVIRCYEIGRGNNHFMLFMNYFSYSISASLKALFMKEEFDVVFVNQLSPVMMGIPAMVYKKKHHKKILYYCLDLWPDSLAAGGIKVGSLVYKAFSKISKWIYNSADITLITSSMFRAYFENTLGMKPERIHHLPQYAEDLFIKKEFEINIDTEINSADKKFNFVFAGNIGDMQSVDTIIRAADELRTYHRIIFHIVGDGSSLEECKRLSVKLNLQNVIFHGRKPIYQMPKFYGMADAMLITLKNNRTLSYTLPGKVQSYLAAGKPIIGSINGETSRVIKESGCGLCCKAEDYRTFANLILQFCDNDQKDKMASNAKKFYFNNFSKEQFMTKLENALNSLED